MMLRNDHHMSVIPAPDCLGFGRILIVGASGNLGGELARQLAGPGVCLSLWGRNAAALAAVAEDCRSCGAEAIIRSLDLRDLSSALAALAQADAETPFDLVLLAAGQGDTLTAGEIVESPEQVARLGQVNFVAPAALAAEIAVRMAQRRRGHIGLISTAAASHSLPFAAAYSGSKAGLSRYADALRLAVKPHGVKVTLVEPGFFAAAAAGGPARARPGELPVKIVAQRIIRAVMRGQAYLITPWPFLMLRWIDRLLPRPIRDRLLLSLRLR